MINVKTFPFPNLLTFVKPVLKNISQFNATKFLNMKTIIKPLLFIAVLLTIISASCKKDSTPGDGLPPLTFEGKNTIGCKINGVNWVPKGISDFGTGIRYPVVGSYYGHPFFPGVHILIKTNSPDGYIELFWRNYSGNNLISTGKYYFNKSTGDIAFGIGEIHSYAFYHTNGKAYFTDSLHTGWIEILKSDSVISGRFEFDGYNSSDGKVYHITEGRFDVK